MWYTYVDEPANVYVTYMWPSEFSNMTEIPMNSVVISTKMYNLLYIG